MKKLLCNSLIASVIAVAGAAGFAGEAKAQTADVDFTGNVGNTCEITKVKDGKLVVFSSDDKVLHSRPDLDAGAELGEVSVNCNTSGEISASNPIPVSADANTMSQKPGFSTQAYLYDQESDLNDANAIVGVGKPTATITPNGTAQPIYVHMGASSDETVSSGNYTFRTTVTVAPQ